jgi:hypothetical protein
MIIEKEMGGADVDYLTVKEAGKKWGITARMATYYCIAERIPGAIKKGNLWLIPASAEKPLDGRYKKNKTENGDGK